MILTKTRQKINQDEERLVSAMAALGDKTRFKLFKLLMLKQQLCVSEIASELKVSVPAVSQHFRIFELLGIVGKQRIGQKVCYELNSKSQLNKNLIKLIKKGG